MLGRGTTSVPGFATKAIHARPTEGPAGEINIPVSLSTTFRYPETKSGGKASHIYSRYDNPTVQALETRLAAIEGAAWSLSFASGMAAVHAGISTLVRPGAGIAVQSGCYGGTLALLQDEYAPRGHEIHVVDKLGEALPEGVGLVIMESITNPTLRVEDVREWARVAHDSGAKLLVDATFATPLLQQPLSLGADLVVHSASKALGGHSDFLAGVVSGNDFRDQVWLHRRNVGAILDPSVANLLARSLSTLQVRVTRQSETAKFLAGVLESRGVRVLYPGLESHGSHAMAAELLRMPGTVLTLDLDSLESAVRFRQRVKLITPAASLGGVESLCCLPIETSHAYPTEEERLRQGVTDGMVRVSVGLEDADDLLEDLLGALELAPNS